MASRAKYPKAEIIREHLLAEPTVATKTLARRLYAKYPKTWTSLESCRKAIMTIRGANGEKHRQETKNTIPRPAEDAEACRKWGALLPEPMPNSWGWRTLPKGPKRWLILSDIHFPFHDKEALGAALDYGHGRCDGVLLNGDVVVDMYSLSRF